MTKTDVDHARHHIHGKPKKTDNGDRLYPESYRKSQIYDGMLGLSGNHEKPTRRPERLEEEHTNVIPHIPNYWTPSQTSSLIYSGNKKNYVG